MVTAEKVSFDVSGWPIKAWVVICCAQAWLEGVIWIFQLRTQEHRASREGVRLFNIEWQSRVGIQGLELSF